MDDFPSNRQTPSARPVREEGPGKQAEVKQVRRVIEGEVIRRKKPLGRRLRDLFVGDGRSIRDMVLEDILVPGFRDMAYDAFTSGVEGMLYRGDHRPRGRRPSQRGGGGGWSNGGTRYDRISGGGSRDRRDREDPRDRREISDRARSRHDFDEVILATRAEADEVLGQLYDLLERYDAVTVHDLYHMVGISSTPMDHKWGWTELFDSGITRTRGGGYLLDLPNPEYLKD